MKCKNCGVEIVQSPGPPDWMHWPSNAAFCMNANPTIKDLFLIAEPSPETTKVKDILAKYGG